MGEGSFAGWQPTPRVHGAATAAGWRWRTFPGDGAGCAKDARPAWRLDLVLSVPENARRARCPGSPARHRFVDQDGRFLENSDLWRRRVYLPGRGSRRSEYRNDPGTQGKRWG